eukprot:tig00000821_g4470.t1
MYETDKILHEYILFHYAPGEELIEFPDAGIDVRAAYDFPKRCALECVKAARKVHGPAADLSKLRALDIGCAVGRSTFELAREFGEAVGLDYSHKFVECCDRLKARGQEAYRRVEEGANASERRAEVDPAIDRSRTRFLQGDACALDAAALGGPADIVLGANLIDRLHTPSAFLEALPRLLKPGGLLVLTSPYTWMTDFTPKEAWLGGKDGRGTHEGLRAALEPLGIVPLYDTTLPFLIREHRRKFQLSFAHCTVWVRKA